MHPASHSIVGVQWAIVLGVAGLAASVQAYQLGNRWTTTATDGGGLSQGDPATITWGLVDDGVSISGSEGTSDSSLIAFLNTHVGTMDVWMPLFEDAFNRWGEVSGLTFAHEPNNSQAAINSTSSPFGSIGVVPDIRIGGHSIDGSSGPNTLAYNYFPNHGDMVIDTDNSSYFGNSSGNYRRLKNTVMHESGHGLGIEHVESNNSGALLEPFISTSFDGPQFDDILAIQRLYGDAWEKGDGNDDYLNATDLGLLSASTVSIGTDANDTVVGADDIDFISIDDNKDLDFFSFTIDAPSLLAVNLTPMGPTYNQGPQDGTQAEFDASSQSDLSFTIYDMDGTNILASANEFGLGDAEAVDSLLLGVAGTYYVGVSGNANTAQFYQLDLEASTYYLPGDVNLDGELTLGSGDVADDDVAAFVAGWLTVSPDDDDLAAWMKGDLNFDRVSDLADWSLLRSAFISAGFGQQLQAWRAVPEPASATCLVLLLAVVITARGVLGHG